MEPRSDSRLTDLYVQGHLAMPADVVARELMATEFLYQRTAYGCLLQDFMRSVADRLRKEHTLSWTATWRIVQFYGPIALKLMCLSASRLAIPERL